MFDLISQHLTYPVIVAVLVASGIGLPIPEELPVMAAGVLSAQQPETMNPWIAYLCCVVGAIGGDTVMYCLGRRFGKSVPRDHPWVAWLLKPEREKYYEQVINKHGVKVFFTSRFLVGVRSPVFLAAGALRVPFRRFIVVDTIAATVVTGTFFSLGYLFADQIQSAWKWIRGLEIGMTLIVLAVIAGVAGFFYLRHRRRVARIRTRRENRAAKLRVGVNEPVSPS